MRKKFRTVLYIGTWRNFIKEILLRNQDILIISMVLLSILKYSIIVQNVLFILNSIIFFGKFWHFLEYSGIFCSGKNILQSSSRMLLFILICYVPFNLFVHISEFLSYVFVISVDLNE